jgi:hypothetical protein
LHQTRQIQEIIRCTVVSFPAGQHVVVRAETGTHEAALYCQTIFRHPWNIPVASGVVAPSCRRDPKLAIAAGGEDESKEAPKRPETTILVLDLVTDLHKQQCSGFPVPMTEVEIHPQAIQEREDRCCGRRKHLLIRVVVLLLQR